MSSLLRKAQKRIRMALSKATVRRLLRESRAIKLEIGGDQRRAGWVTLDVTDGCDLYWDLTYGLPFPDASVEKIYASHLLEHFSHDETQKLLAECLRVLVPGGCMSVCVPNARIYIDAYVQGHQLDSSAFFAPAFRFNSGLDYVNYMAYMAGHHKHMFDPENLSAVLARAGFCNAAPRAFDPNLDLEQRRGESIYAEAYKSAATQVYVVRDAA